ncbi:hypothetical protein ABBQ38_013776 [Trebouxia sp. C0009 RCD-2024]
MAGTARSTSWSPWLVRCGMRRRTPAAHSVIAEPHCRGVSKQTGDGRANRRRRVSTFPQHVVGHPLFGFFLFLALFPGYALVSLCRKLCAEGPEYCAQAVRSPFNLTGTAFQKLKADFRQRCSGEPDTFQSATAEAHKAITKNFTELKSALKTEQALTSQQQALIQSAVSTIHKQLEQYACCTTAPPFLIAPSGHWTQDSKSAADVLKQLVSAYTYDSDQQDAKPFWQRILGRRQLLGSTSSSQAEQQHMGKGRFWGSHTTSPSPDMPTPPQHGTASRPTLKRQNAFKLSENESQALNQQLGLSSHGHSGSGHDLLSAAAEESTQAVQAGSANSRAAVGSDNILSSVKGSLGGALLRAIGTDTSPGLVPDLHRPFNATSAYANVTRCNPKRWVALYTSGTNFSQPRASASGETVYPPARVTAGPSENQGYKATPLTSFQGKVNGTEGRAQVLVVYHYYESLTTCEEDEEIQVIRGNLLTFLRFAVRENDGADYVVSLGGRINSSLLDLIPAYCNVRVRFVDNSTMHSDTCSFHRALVDFGPTLLERYKHYVVINNGMRGPFARAGQGHEQQHWTYPFTQKLDSHVKLVGPYLSCEIEVHIQGPFLVMDRVGLRYLLDLWGGCWRDHQADIQNAEVGLSRALLADGYNIASLQHEYAGLDFRRQPDRLHCKGRLPGSNPTFCCDVPDPLQLHWVKYGGLVYRLGLIPPTLIRMVEDMTARTMALTPPLVPNGSHWHLPTADWVQQQRQAGQEHSHAPSWWEKLFRGPARLLGLVEDSLQGDEAASADPDWTLVKRVAALLESVPETTQRTANSFQCGVRDEYAPGLRGWLGDAAT